MIFALVLVAGITIGLSIDLLMLRMAEWAKSYDQRTLDTTWSNGYVAGREQRKLDDLTKLTEKAS